MMPLDIRFLTLDEFHKVYFYRFITLAILLAIGVLILTRLGSAAPGELLLVSAVLLVMAWRFALEYRRLNSSAPAFIQGDELVLSSEKSHRQIKLSSISAVKSQHSVFMVRRYQSWSDHLAFMQFTLHNGERLYTLVESPVLQFPAARHSLAALKAAVLAAKVRNL